MFSVREEDSDKRIDKFLQEKSEYSREYIQKLIKQGLVLVNEKVVKPSYKVLIDDKIVLKEEKINNKEVLAKADIPLDIVFEDDDIMVINKPSGLVVHPGNGNFDNTLVNALLNYTSNLSNFNEDFRPGIVHRIDKDTSGLLLVAKSNKAHLILAEDFKNKRVKREYIALVDGVIKENSALIDAPIGRDPNKRDKMAVRATNSKQAVTHVKVLKRYKAHTLVKCVLETGRTHQIRVHMAYIGYPVHNDPVYQKKQTTSFGQFLHSAKMTFEHPITKEILSFECALPQEFQNFLEEIAND